MMRKYFILIILSGTFSCAKFTEVDLPKTLMDAKLIFSNDITATSAISGIYHDMILDGSGFASGSYASVTNVCGLSADELTDYDGSPLPLQYQQNELLPDNSYTFGAWSSAYKYIYAVNSLLEGVGKSTGMTAAAKEQLTGEALFIRAFTYLHLTNLFGSIPLVLTTDYQQNMSLGKTPRAGVYQQIVEDLETAIGKLNETYPAPERIRPNKFAAMALLARVYLYGREWAKAEELSSEIIARSADYDLEPVLNNVFLHTSKETLWQLKPVTSFLYTNEGFNFIKEGYISGSIVSPSLRDGFEAGDNRRTSWIDSTEDGSGYVLYPFKYKSKFVTEDNPKEYSIVLRLAEQYLIRAEARAELGNIEDAEDDINEIRNRAGLNPIAVADRSAAMQAIEKERRCELFTEWGHRWFDLIRWKRVLPVLGNIKPALTANDTLYPIPIAEIRNNIHLLPQNLGY